MSGYQVGESDVITICRSSMCISLVLSSNATNLYAHIEYAKLRCMILASSMLAAPWLEPRSQMCNPTCSYLRLGCDHETSDRKAVAILDPYAVDISKLHNHVAALLKIMI